MMNPLSAPGIVATAWSINMSVPLTNGSCINPKRASSNTHMSRYLYGAMTLIAFMIPNAKVERRGTALLRSSRMTNDSTVATEGTLLFQVFVESSKYPALHTQCGAIQCRLAISGGSVRDTPPCTFPQKDRH